MSLRTMALKKARRLAKRFPAMRGEHRPVRWQSRLVVMTREEFDHDPVFMPVSRRYGMSQSRSFGTVSSRPEP